MQIQINSIPQNIVDGTNETMCNAVKYMNKVLGAQPPQLALEKGQEFLVEKSITVQDVMIGLSYYIQRIKYMGSRGVVENLTSLLACDDNDVVRDTMRQWKEAEESMWEVVADAE